MADPMKVMIVEDEAFIRQGIISKINWPALGLELAAEAEDGETALDILERQKIDLIITDICLPRMDGFELIRYTADLGKPAKFIVISGYDKFEYARTAMKYRVTEYLLKPVKESELHDSLRKMKQELQNERMLESRMRDAAQLSRRQRLQWRDDFLGRLIRTSGPEPKELDQFCEQFGWNGTELVTVAVMSLSPLAEERPGLNEELLYFGLRNIFQEIAAGQPKTLFFRNAHAPGEFVFLSGCAESHAKMRLHPLFNAYIQAVKQYLKLQATIGISGTRSGLQSIARSYADALFAVRQRILQGAGTVIDYDLLPKQHQLIQIQPVDRELVHCLDERRKPEALMCIRTLFARIETDRHRLCHVQVQEIILRTYMVLKKFREDHGMGQDGILPLEDDLPRLLTRWQSLSEAAAWFEDKVERLFETIDRQGERTGKEIVEAVKKFIDANYHRNISLQYIAETYHIHPIYFSRIFKSYVGQSFSSYLTAKRMEKANELLHHPGLRLQEISEIVGYEDPKYFSKVYKKHYGVSPSVHAEFSSKT